MRPNYIISERYSWEIRKWIIKFFVGNCFEEAVDADLDKAREIAQRVVNNHDNVLYEECKVL